MRIFIGLAMLVGLLSGCSSLQQIDRSRLNHPAMDLNASRTPQQSAFLTNIGSIKQSGSGGACSVCAH